MSTSNITKATKTLEKTLKRHSPEILTGFGIVGMATTTVLAVKATPRALVLIEEEKRRQNFNNIEEAKANGYDQCEHVTKLSPMDTIRATWRCYLPAAVTGSMAVLCLVGASSVNARRNAALVTAYTLSESAIKEYREKVIETVGEKKEKEVREAVSKERVERNPVVTNEVIITEKGGTLCYDVLSGRYFKSDIDAIKKAVNDSNYQLISHSYISLNDFYTEIGLSDTRVGNDLGWNITQGQIEIDFDSQLATDGTPCLVLDYINAPQYNFDRWM